jgi:hypothetical protein
MSGELMKINFDFKEKYFASKLTHPQRFANVEFMHSASLDQVRSLSLSPFLSASQ